MPPCHTIATLLPEHLERVAAIERRSFANPWPAADLHWVVHEETAICLGLWVDEVLIGYAIGHREGEEFHLASLAIDPAHRRQGWGGMLLEQTLSHARQHQCATCQLEVRAANGVAARLYRRHGFGQVGVWRAYYTRPVEDALVMKRTL